MDHAFGGTLDGKYFVSNNFAFGISFSGYDVKNIAPNRFNVNPTARRFIGSFLPTVTYRYPLNGNFAPYAFAGAGMIFNGGNSIYTEPSSGSAGQALRFEKVEHDVKLDVESGIGVEYRFSKTFGVFSEAAFDKVDRPHSNFATFRSGVTISFQ